MTNRQNSKPPISLNEAVLKYAPRRLRAQYERARKAPYPSEQDLAVKDVAKASDRAVVIASKFLARMTAQSDPRFEMEEGLRHRILIGELEAWGLQTKPLSVLEKVLIPAFFFENLRGISWQGNSINKAAHKFEMVEVRQPEAPESDAAAAHSVVGDEPREAISADFVGNDVSKRGGGRTSNYDKSRHILAMLYQEHEGYKDMSAAKVLDIFRKRFREVHVAPGVAWADISQRSLQDHIKRYRQELARIGKN